MPLFGTHTPRAARSCSIILAPPLMQRTGPSSITLEDLGWGGEVAQRVPEGMSDLSPARVASVYAALVDLWTPEGPRLASLRSRALREAPIEGGVAVGDWALVAPAAPSADEVVV